MKNKIELILEAKNALEDLFFGTEAATSLMNKFHNIIEAELRDAWDNFFTIPNEVSMRELMFNVMEKLSPEDKLSEQSKTEIDIFQYFIDNGLTLKEKINEQKFGREIRKNSYSYNAMLKNTFVGVYMNYENFISTFMSTYFKLNPKRISREKTVVLDDVLKSKNINELIDIFVEKEVEEMMRKPSKQIHEEIYKLNFNTEFYSKFKLRIHEISARRNVIVHNGSKINAQYIKSCGNIFNFKIDSEVELDTRYILESIDILVTNTIIMCCSFLNSLNLSIEDVNEIKPLTDAISTISFYFLNDHKWQFTYYIYKIIKEIDSMSNFQEGYVLNYLLSGKQIKDESCQEEIRKYNYSSRTLLYQVGYLGMECKHKELLDLLSTVKLDEIEDFGKDSFQSWPIFLDLRTKHPEEFSKIIKLFENKTKLV